MDDTLVLIKPSDIPSVVKKFNSFDKNLNFTVDKFENGKVHFLDLEISESGNIYNIHNLVPRAFPLLGDWENSPGIGRHILGSDWLLRCINLLKMFANCKLFQYGIGSGCCHG